ncbi:hypothetical protein ACIPYS_35010 [Kitasatospora sp. NPDC089913]|uniref:hypothetical protein n=1 Tax=Streptomycetaceae TaxID=2062 RepID=UPI0008795EC6|nr:hypothetical protein [Streptomyces sp. TLI_053]SDT82974.1 hypothetical protein SAMN05216371_7786 [Streptomyces sp. TLI_053]
MSSSNRRIRARTKRAARPAGAAPGPAPAPSRELRRRLVRTLAPVTGAVGFVAVYLGAVRLSTGVRQFLDFGAGVLALVCLSSAVLWGLLSTDRFLLYSDHRLVSQSVHRVLAVAGLAFLALHIWIKVAERHTTGVAAALPFGDAAQPVLVGLGTLAGYGFVGVAVTGAARSRFASQRGALVWRLLHMTSYLAWGAALVHGLRAGREGKDWVTVSYVCCLVAVALVLVLKLRSNNGRPPTAGPGTTLPGRPATTAPRPDGGPRPPAATTVRPGDGP